MKKRILATTLAITMVLGITFSQPGVIAMAAANENVSVDVSLFEAGIEPQEEASTDIKYQEPVEITEFEQLDGGIVKPVENVVVDPEVVQEMPMTYSDSTIIAGSVSDYLTETEDYKIYNISLPADVVFQAQLTTPNNADIDYDIYMLNADGEILAGSDYYTYINGTSGTLPEAFGYHTTDDTATYYLYVLSSAGGSVTQPFTLDYAIAPITACDSFEIDDHASQALAFTFGSDGAYIDSRNLHSPIDNDWYKITVPSNRTYGKLNITATTSSTNTCSVEVYQNVASEEGCYQMKKVGGSGNVAVSEGTYYVRVFNAKSMEDFDDMDIQNYTLSVTPILTATSISITSLSGTEGEKYVTYTGYGRYFRSSTGTVTVTGYATTVDPTTNTTYYAADTDVVVMYYNPAWEENNTMDWAYVYGYGTTDATGKYTIQIDLPHSTASICVDTGVSYHYFDLCAIYAFIADDVSVNTYKPMYHYAYSIYHKI